MHYRRNLLDLQKVKKNGYKVFSCFSCGGGSSMGYKNAGFEVIGTCEIDPKMNKVYQKNFGKGVNYEMGVQEMEDFFYHFGEIIGSDATEWRYYRWQKSDKEDARRERRGRQYFPRLILFWLFMLITSVSIIWFFSYYLSQ